jgi:hypothetical protein
MDILALIIWIYGYYVVIRSFAVLQRLEKFLAGVRREEKDLSRKV